MERNNSARYQNQRRNRFLLNVAFPNTIEIGLGIGVGQCKHTITAVSHDH